MNFPVPHFRPQAAFEPPAMVRHVGREDVLWNRWVFKAPPLEVHPKLLDATVLAEDLRRIGLGER